MRALILQAITPCAKISGLATRDYLRSQIVVAGVTGDCEGDCDTDSLDYNNISYYAFMHHAVAKEVQLLLKLKD